MKKNKLIRNIDTDTIIKLNKLCAILGVNQSELLKELTEFYFKENETKLRQKALELIKAS